MTKLPKSNHSTEINRAREALADPNIVWHSVNGFDLGAVFGILRYGIEPRRLIGNLRGVSLIPSPATSTAHGHRLFDFYLKHSVSFAVPRPDSYRQFGDEIQSTDSIPDQHLLGVMIPEEVADTPVGQLPLLKPFTKNEVRSYLIHQIEFFDFLGNIALSTEIREKIKEYDGVYSKHNFTYSMRKAMAKQINADILAKFQVAFAELLGSEQPTLEEAVRYLTEEYNLDLMILPTTFVNRARSARQRRY